MTDVTIIDYNIFRKMKVAIIIFLLICIFNLIRNAEPKIFNKITIQRENEDYVEKKRFNKRVKTSFVNKQIHDETKRRDSKQS